MSVVSKALTVAVLATVVSGCATISRSSNQTGDTQRLSESPRTAPVLDLALDADEVGASNGAATIDEPAIAATIAAPSRAALAAETKSLLGTGPVNIVLEQGSDFSRVLLTTKGEPTFDVQNVNAPPRLVLDLLGEKGGQSRTLNVGEDEFLKSVRLGSHQDRTRVVFDLTALAADESQVERVVDEQGGRIAVTFRKRGSGEISATTKKNTVTAAAEKAPSAVASDSTAPVRLDKVTFTREAGAAGQVQVLLTDEVPFDLSHDTPTEYVLTLPGVTAAERTRIPLVSPPGFPGIRSTRAVQDGENVRVRMFVDAGIGLVAIPKGRTIVIEATKPTVAEAAEVAGKNRKARAQVSDAPAGQGAPVAAPIEADEKARANPTGVSSDDGSKLYTGRLISLDLQDTDIDNALRIIAEVSNLNIIASDDVTGKVTLRLIDVPWDQALDVILKTNGLDQVTEGNVVRIAPVDKLRQEREALLEARRAALNLEDLKVNYVRVSYARATELKEQIESVLTERGSVSIDERTNQIIVKDIKRGQDEAIALIKKLDLRTPQVLLETEIVEADRNFLRDLGFQWNYSYVASPQTGNATGLVFPNSIDVTGGTSDAAGAPWASNFPATLGNDAGSAVTAILESADGSRTLAMRLSALESEGKGKVISRPQVATVNNKQAEIKSVETLRVRLPDSGLSVATGAGASASGGAGSAVEEIEVGITLRVTPQASSDYFVLLDVNAKSSTLGNTVVDNIPSTIDRQATSTILVKSGQTFALGGIYRVDDQDDIFGIPWFKDVPVVGALFRRTAVSRTDNELIFFITPHIVEGSFDPAAMS